ncbi:hypothetical protein GCM10022197_20950 [Microlunatus spumicola]|uniref:DUF1772 domain-containing protein n=1 Tax=Microlunatus spumicola TaxID=81499 RepID=A0ABP6XEI2_9ACTN
MSSSARVVEATHLVTLAALTGLVGLDPTARLRSAPDYAGWLAGQQRVDRVMSRVAPPLFLSAAATAVGAALVAGAGHRPALAVSRIVAATCVAVAVRVTLTVNEPANARLRAWRPDAVPPDDWRAVRARWDEGHRQRRVLVAAGAAAVTLGLLVDRRFRRG